ncbi:[Fe-S]-dependent transcriptional repressor FeoC [Shimwellia blattae]|uniref:Probable [Fe-S]-dependent transcriptional repressor n=1 Tax=Shimwellia blattae (strain ATCC 29907 / DSM 4481 / JCM 1650 / NBRC 105725 / CDC 9005-74) TaxID=630626 RepID=I2B4A0_SHIBC|nr:[Fe-S]-dependent transcriptional repressor FeoC [Shimwellia blattae]AFJ45354.1 putative DNA-binding transcriptional regulator [Shimwellia blattae DSM 4481 = NBRC 105725]GAB82841.1 ferrous iron transport protein C [Shimwellia blattae DSM 4481 = NBRC 105725]VDY62836.1 Ferrous iron transport protein C [Shimwellia blattae]VEC19726.1 Ferrous iron transport protein C [Shimwellia blattae]
MATLIEVRDLLALRGRLEAGQISQLLNTPRPMVDAMLDRLAAMGKATTVTDDLSGCLHGSCKECPDGKKCQPVWWTLC